MLSAREPTPAPATAGGPTVSGTPTARNGTTGAPGETTRAHRIRAFPPGRTGTPGEPDRPAYPMGSGLSRCPAGAFGV
jgi:hypothetical protein